MTPRRVTEPSVPRKPYSPPILTKFGSVAELTRGQNGTIYDMGQMTDSKKGFG